MTRKEKAEALAKFLSEEFSKRKTLAKKAPSKDVAELVVIALERNLQAKGTAVSNRILSIYKHLHAYAECLRPYGIKSHKAGHYQVWIEDNYMTTSENLIKNTKARLEGK